MGARAKITPQQIYIIGIVLTLISAVVIYFTLIKPGNDAYDAAKADYDIQEAQAEKMGQAKKDRATAIAAVATANRKWAIYDRQLMPNIDLSNRFNAMKQLWREEIEVLGPKVDRFLRADHSVQVLSAAISMPQPPSDPNQVITKQFTFPLGTVSVVGTFNDVLNNAERWNKFDRLVLMDNLTLTGNSPRLVGQYTLTCFELTHNFDTPGPAFPAAATPTGGGAGGGPGGMPSGFEVGGASGGGRGGAAAPGGPGAPGGMMPSGGPPPASGGGGGGGIARMPMSGVSTQ